MKILLGKIENQVQEGILLGDRGRFQISVVSGLETPPIRNNFGNWSGNDGGYASSQLYSVRQITIKGFTVDETAFCEGIQSARQELSQYLQIRKKYPIFIQLANNEVFYAEGYLADFKMDFTSYNYNEFLITLYCPDNGLYKCESFGDVNSVTKRKIINSEISGGHLVPEDLPVLFEEGMGNTVVNNEGTTNYYPVFEIIGPFTAPFTITNQTTNQSFTLDQNIEMNEFIEIDMNQKTVMSGGVSISADIAVDSEWIYLKPGLNRIIFESGDPNSDNTYITVVWKSQLIGI